MEVASILQRFWSVRLGLAIALVVAVIAGVLSAYRLDLSPPGLENRGVEYGAATASLLIDSTREPLVNLTRDIEPLSLRGSLFSAFTRTAFMRRDIARRAGVRPSDLVMSTGASGPTTNQTRTGEQRSNFLTYEGTGYRVLTSTAGRVPVIDIFATAPDARTATGLARATADALIAYTDRKSAEARAKPRPRLQPVRPGDEAKPPAPPDYVKLRLLGDPVGGTVNQGAGKQVAALVAVVVLVLASVALLMIANVRDALRAARSGAAAEGQ